jgi:AcrR family transcriptional regulator
MVKKAPRRTAERILEVTLELFNRFGEPNVSTTLISAELGISPGNLYYHYPAKDELINSLFDRYERAERVAQRQRQRAQCGGRLVLHAHAVRADLAVPFFVPRPERPACKNRRLETHFQWVLKNKTRSVKAMLDSMSRAGAMRMDSREHGSHRHQHGGGADLLAEL